MKKFINEHPKVYWMIVGVLAVIAFSVVTAIGCAKLETAEASSEICINAEQINYDTLPTYQQVVDWVVQYYGVAPSEVTADNTVIFSGDGVGYNIFHGDAISRLECYGLTSGANINAKSYVYKITYNANTGNVEYSSFSGSFMGVYFERSAYLGYIWGKPIYCWSRNGVTPYINEVTDYPTEVKPVAYTYFINAPYLEATDVEVYNALLENPRITDIEASEWTVYFDLKGQPMNSVTHLVAENDYYIWLPSYDFISTKIGQYEPMDMGNDAALYNYNLSGLAYDIAGWQGKVGSNRNSVLYKIHREEEYNPAYNIKERYDYKDLQDIIEYQYGYRDADGEWVDFSLAEYYGFEDDDRGWINIWRPIVFSYLHISRVDSQLYTYVAVSETETDVYYGRYMIYDFVLTDTVVNTAISEDMQSENRPGDADSIIDASREESYKDIINDMYATEEELKEQIGNMTGSLGSFDTEFEGVDLWNGIKGFGSGLIGLTGFLGNIATALGSVFVFMPYDVRQLVGYFFMASLVVALWKLIKR